MTGRPLPAENGLVPARPDEAHGSGGSFGPYRLDALIGRGGMGEVHRAYDTVRKRVVALKRLPAHLAADPRFQARFRTESELAARLSSAHVIPIHDYGEIDGQLFIDMRLVDGEDLADRLARERVLSPVEGVHLLSQVASALDAAHAAGLEHRDVKPSNVLLSPREGSDGLAFAYLVDFGIARAVDAERGPTGTGEVVGTLAYMAPERFTAAPSDHRVDVYSLAALLHELLTGAKPFRTDSAAEAMFCHLQVAPPRPSTLRPGLSEAFDAVIARGMAKNAHDRYPSAGALAAAARTALQQPVPGHPAARWRPPAHNAVHRPASLGRPPAPSDPTLHPPGWSRPRRRRRLPLVLTALLVTAIVAVGAVVVNRGGDPAPLPAGPSMLRVAENLPVNASSGLAIDPSGHRFFVGRPGGGGSGNVVEVHDVDGGALVATIPLPGDSYVNALQLSRDGNTLYAGTSVGTLSSRPSTGSVLVIDLARSTVTATLRTPERVSALAPSPDGTRLYAVAGPSVAVVDPARSVVVRTVPTGQDGIHPGIAVTPDGRSVLVSGSAGLKIIDPAAGVVTSTIGLRGDPAGIAITPDGARALIATSGSHTLAVLDLRSGRATGAVPVGGRPEQVAITPDGAQAVVTNDETGTASVVDLATWNVTPLAVGQSQGAVALGPDGHFGLVVTMSNVVKIQRV